MGGWFVRYCVGCLFCFLLFGCVFVGVCLLFKQLNVYLSWGGGGADSDDGRNTRKPAYGQKSFLETT